VKVRTCCVLCFATMLLIAPSPIIAQGHVPHTVQPGESLWSIAAQGGLSVEELAAANGLSPDAALVAGATVLIPPASNPAQSPDATGISAAPGSGECVWDCASPVHPHPTDESVTPQHVRSIAAEYGMSAPLVQSIAWNESAFSNAAVSSAEGRGVMQIIPATWNFIQEQLTAPPLDPASATDNVKAGVIYLHHLYHLKGGDGQATVASYHQGPSREGLLAETRTYLHEIRHDQAHFAGG
jgi:murein DD-endopeptidase MepM/ murein hydrolase activator NlpD